MRKAQQTSTFGLLCGQKDHIELAKSRSLSAQRDLPVKQQERAPSVSEFVHVWG